MARRVHYIDWLRVLAVLLLFPFHAGRVFDYGQPFYADSSHAIPLRHAPGAQGAGPEWADPLKRAQSTWS